LLHSVRFFPLPRPKDENGNKVYPRDYLELWWLPVDQDDGIDADYFLSNGTDILGTAKCERDRPKFFVLPGRRHMLVTVGDDVWTFWSDWSCTTIHNGETEDEIARFIYGRGDEGLLEVYSGDCYIWNKRQLWRTYEWGWFRTDEKALVYLERCSGWPTYVNVAIMALGSNCSDLDGGRDSDWDC
jgi:hypothetical protein